MSADIFTNSGCYIPASGYRYTTGALGYVGTNGDFWSGSPYATELHGYILSFDSSAVYPANNGTRAYSRSVRCVAVFNE